MSLKTILRGRAGASSLLEGLSAPFDFAALPKVTADTHLVFERVEGSAQFNLHSYIEYAFDKFWVMWSTGAVEEDDEGQHVVYATSEDGESWTEPTTFGGTPPEGFRHIARGFWQTDDRLLALYSFDEVGPYFGESLEVRACEVSAEGISAGHELMVEGFINNYAPVRTRDRQWVFGARDTAFDVFVLKGDGDAGNWRQIEIPGAAELSLNEPTIQRLEGSRLECVFRNQGSDRVLYASHSYDNGETWSPVRPTVFPDARSKNFTMAVGDSVLLLNNSQSALNRIPLTLAKGEGFRFNEVYVLQDAATAPEYPASAKVPGYMYPHAIVVGDDMWITYSRNKEDIYVMTFPLNEIGL